MEENYPLFLLNNVEKKSKKLKTLIEIAPDIQSSFKIKYWNYVIKMFANNKINTIPELTSEV